MFSNKVQPSGCSRLWGTHSFFLQIGSFFLFALLAIGAQAQWQDPLVTPALHSKLATEALLLDIAKADARLVAVGAYGHIIYSDDNGITWRQANVPMSITFTSVHFVSGKIGWAAGHDGVILKTTDGGENWKKQFDGFIANQEIVNSLTQAYQLAEEQLDKAEQKNDQRAIAIAQERLETLEFKLDDANYDLETGSTKPFLDIWFYDANKGFAVGAYGMLFYTENGGNNWKSIASETPNPENNHLNSITQVGPNALVIAGERGLLIRSDDFGASWHKLDSPYHGSLFGMAATGDQQLLYGLRGHIFRTDDGGFNWTEIREDSEQTLLGSFVGRNKVFLVGNGGVLIEFDSAMKKSKLHLIEGGKAFSAVTQAVDGTIVLVGEAGVLRLNSKAQIVSQAMSVVTSGGQQ